MSSRSLSSLVLCAALCLALGLSGACSSVSAVRLQPEAVEVGPGLRPIAAIQANATSAYILFIPIPGGATLDRVINQMLVAKAKAMGADKVAQLTFENSPEGGIWTLWKLLGWRSAQATAIAVQVTGPDADPAPEAGPEGPGSSPPAPARTEQTPSAMP